MRSGLSVVVAVSAALLAPNMTGTQTPVAEPIGILLVAGDIAKCNPASAKDEATAAVLGRAVTDARSRNIPVRVLALGDLAYDHGTSAQFSCFHQSWGAFKDVMLPVPGNHDYENPPNQDAAPFFAYFSTAPFPPEGRVVTANGPKAGYYAVNFPDPQSGPWRMIGLNFYTQAPGGRAGEWQWLKQDLARSTAGCVLAFLHPFLLSSGHHGHENGASVAPVAYDKMEPPFQILHDAGATLLLSGHDHHFEQFARHDVRGRADPNGVRTFVLGTGGAQPYQSAQRSRWPVSEAYSERSNGVLQIDLYVTHYEWRFLPIDGDPPVSLPVQRDGCNARH